MTISGAVTTYMRQHDTILLVQMLIASAALFNQKNIFCTRSGTE